MPTSLVVLLLTVFVDLLVAVAAGMVMATLFFMKKIADVGERRMISAPLSAFTNELPWGDETTSLKQLKEQVYIKHFDGPIFFGLAYRMQEMMQALPGIKTVIMRMERVSYIDQSGLYALEEAIDMLHEEGLQVVF